MFGKYFEALWETWEGKMSGIASLCLLLAGAFSQYFSGEGGIKHLRAYLWIAAALAFAFANWRAWSRQYLRAEKSEAELKDLRAKFIIFPSFNLWRYDNVLDKTLSFILVKLINQGHPSVVTGWTAQYEIGTATEIMTLFHLTSPYSLTMGEELLTVSNDDLIPTKTSETQLLRGGSITGRLMLALEGNRADQFNSALYRITINCFDYLGTTFTASYAPQPNNTPKMMFHAKENVKIVQAPPPQ
jgi:hypothetical protein